MPQRSTAKMILSRQMSSYFDMCAPLAGSERQRGDGGGVVVMVSRVCTKQRKKVQLLRQIRSSASCGVALNQIQAVLSEKSSSSLLHEVHIKRGLKMRKWAQMLILFNRCRSVDYGNAMSGSLSVSSLLLQKLMKIIIYLLFILVFVQSIFQYQVNGFTSLSIQRTNPQQPKTISKRKVLKDNAKIR